jgi:hypothetical protein
MALEEETVCKIGGSLLLFRWQISISFLLPPNVRPSFPSPSLSCCDQFPIPFPFFPNQRRSSPNIALVIRTRATLHPQKPLQDGGRDPYQTLSFGVRLSSSSASSVPQHRCTQHAPITCLVAEIKDMNCLEWAHSITREHFSFFQGTTSPNPNHNPNPNPNSKSN